MARVLSLDELEAEISDAINQLNRARNLIRDARHKERAMRAGMWNEQKIAEGCQALLTEAEDIAGGTNGDGIVAARLAALNWQYQFHVKARPQTGYTSCAISNSGVFGLDVGSGNDAIEPFVASDRVQLRNTEDSANQYLEFQIGTKSGTNSIAAATTISGVVENADDESVELVLVDRQ